jgi:hypothetical protein
VHRERAREDGTSQDETTIHRTPARLLDAHVIVSHVEQTLVRDGDEVGVAADRVEDVLRAGERTFGVDWTDDDLPRVSRAAPASATRAHA